MGIVDEAAFFDEARNYLREAGASVEDVGIDSDLIKDGVLDSLSLLSFLSFLESKRSGLAAPIFDLSGGLTIRDAFNLVREH